MRPRVMPHGLAAVVTAGAVGATARRNAEARTTASASTEVIAQSCARLAVNARGCTPARGVSLASSRRAAASARRAAASARRSAALAAHGDRDA
eukprot:5081031-Prymnesium_polylepis.2